MLAAAPAFAETTVVLDGTVVRFATQQEGAAVLSTRDRFIAALSPFDRQSRLATSKEVSEEEFLAFISSQVRPWQENHIDRLTELLQQVGNRLEPFNLPLPDQILLVHTTGREEGNAAYCRRNAIVLPRRMLNSADDQMAKLLAHELFHILSSHSEELRRSTYGLIGFRECPVVELPDSIKRRKITNPDGPLPNCYIDLEIDGIRRSAVPVLYSSDEKYDPQKGGTFFRYLVFRLMVVEPDGEKWRPQLEDGQPVLLDPQHVDSFHEQIGRNTNYIVHPDEVMAVNFVHLVFQTPDLPTPRVVSDLRELLIEK